MSEIVFDMTEDNVEETINAKDEAIRRALEAVGIQAEGHAKIKCPVDTGRLRGSISHQVGSGFDSSVYIGTNVKYAPSIEYGHKQEVGRYVPAIGKRLKRAFVPAKPFLKPAIEEHLSEYKSIFQKFLKGSS